jgi:quinol monooxygenase YgiN
MASQQLTVVAKIKAKPGLEEKVKQEVLGLIAPTRKEPGCLNYDLHQDQEDKSVLLLYENWVSRKDLDDHLKLPHMVAFLGKAGELLAEPVEIKFYHMVSQKTG